jgi:prevent-host-death family protein
MSADARTWSLANAKTRFSELVEKAKSEGPQTVTRNGKPTAVVVSYEEWARKTSRKGSLMDFLQASPLRDVEIDLDRVRGTPRDLEL